MPSSAAPARRRGLALFPEPPDELRAVLRGRLTDAISAEWRDVLARLAARRPRWLVVDLAAVTFLDAAVIVAIREVERRLAACGGRVAVIAPAGLARTVNGLGAGHLIQT